MKRIALAAALLLTASAAHAELPFVKERAEWNIRNHVLRYDVAQPRIELVQDFSFIHTLMGKTVRDGFIDRPIGFRSGQAAVSGQ